MDQRALADLEHDNFIEAIGHAVAAMPGHVRRRSDGIATLLSGHPLLLFNQILIDVQPSGQGPSVDNALAAAIASARDRAHRFLVTVRSGTDDHVVPVLTDLGLVPLEDGPWMPGMAMRPIVAEVEPSGALEIRRVHDHDGIEDHIRAAAAGFELPDEMLRSMVTDAMLEEAWAALYVGYLDDEPVTSGLGVRTGSTIGVYNIATAPAARRRGFGAAMTARVIADGVAAGCDVAVLQASDMGRPIYERMGFRTVVEYLGYVERRSPADEATPEG